MLLHWFYSFNCKEQYGCVEKSKTEKKLHEKIRETDREERIMEY